MGFLLAAAVAIPLGLLMGTFPAVKHFFAPLLDPLRFLPISALVPLFIVWFGIDEMQKIVFLFVGTFVYLLPLVVEAVENVEEVYLQTATTLGATPGPARPPRADPGQPARHRRGAAGDERHRLDLRDPGRGHQRAATAWARSSPWPASARTSTRSSRCVLVILVIGVVTDWSSAWSTSGSSPGSA